MSAEMQEVPREQVAKAEKPFVWLPEMYLTVGCGPDGWRFVFMHTDAMPTVNSIPLYRHAAASSTPPDLLQMLHECAEYIAALNGEQDDYCQRARALIARATGEVK